MEISIQEVLDYVACPALYRFKHVDKLEPPQALVGRPRKNSIIDLYDQALHKTIAYLFHTVQDGTYPTLRHLAKKWGYIWVKPRAEQEDVRFRQTSWRDTHRIKQEQGWKRLNALWEYYKEHEGTPIMVDYPYKVQIGEHTLTGTIDLVRVVKNENGREEIEMTEFVTDEKNAPFLHIRRDWKVTAASYAFRKVMNVTEQKIVYHGIISGKTFQTERQQQDFEQLEYLLTAIQHMKSADVYYPVFNERCATCPYQKFCEKGWFDVKNQEQ